MKKILLGVISVLLLSACGAPQEFNVHTKGVDAIVLGMTPAELPQAIEGLYDRIEVVTTPAYYDEVSMETTPAFDTYNFMSGEERMFYALMSEEGVIDSIHITSEKLSYGGIHPGMSCGDVLATNAKLVAFYVPGDCVYCCNFRFDDALNIFINFLLTNGGSFSDKGYEKAYNTAMSVSRFDEWYELEFQAEDFKADATISEIQIMNL